MSSLPKSKNDIVEKFGTVPESVIAMFRKKEYDRCFHECEKILAEDPTNGPALMYIGTILHGRKKYRKAIEAIDTLLERVPFLFHAWVLKGQCHLSLSEIELAREAFKKHAEIETDSALAWGLIAITYFFEDKGDVAYFVLDKAADMVKEIDRPILLLLKGMLNEYDGDKDEALINYMNCQYLLADDEKHVASNSIYELISGLSSRIPKEDPEF